MNKTDLLKAGEPRTKSVTIPEVGEVYIREITGEALDYIRGPGDMDERAMFARLVVVGVCGDDGKPLFARKDVNDVNAMKLSVLRSLAEAVQSHSGLIPEDTDELLGNSEPTTTDASGTD